MESPDKRRKPGKSTEVQNFMEFVKKEQELVGITPKQARVILRNKVRLLIQKLQLLRDTTRNARKKMLISRNIAIFSIVFCSTKRGYDISKIVAANALKYQIRVAWC